MNPLDAFARLRPDEPAATVDELDDIWSDIVENPPIERDADPEIGLRSPRRLAFAGAAAVILLGVVAIASFADRADAPAVSGGDAFAVPTAASPESGPSVPEDVAEADDVPEAEAGTSLPVEADEPPVWGIAEEGWTLEELVDQTDGPVDMVQLFAGPDGLETSWVAIVRGMSEPLLPVGAEPESVGRPTVIVGDQIGESAFPVDTDPDRNADPEPDDDEGDASAISSQRIATEQGSLVVTSGGVSRALAMSVFEAVQDGSAPPGGFVETNSADALVRTVTYRFVHETEDAILIAVTSGGIPNYDGRIEEWETEPDTERPGVDESAVLLIDDGRAVVARTGFWVSTIAAPPSLLELPQLIDEPYEGNVFPDPPEPGR